MKGWHPADIGFAVRAKLADLGLGARLFVRLLLGTWASWRRFGLIRDQIHFLGNYSLSIIAVSGLFVGFVFGLQGYYTLQRYGSSEALGLLVTLSLVRELGPVVAALLFASRAGSAITAEIGLMKTTEQLKAMDMMAVDPIARVVVPRFWGGVITMPGSIFHDSRAASRRSLPDRGAGRRSSCHATTPSTVPIKPPTAIRSIVSLLPRSIGNGDHRPPTTDHCSWTMDHGPWTTDHETDS